MHRTMSTTSAYTFKQPTRIVNSYTRTWNSFLLCLISCILVSSTSAFAAGSAGTIGWLATSNLQERHLPRSCPPLPLSPNGNSMSLPATVDASTSTTSTQLGSVTTSTSNPLTSNAGGGTIALTTNAARLLQQTTPAQETPTSPLSILQRTLQGHLDFLGELAPGVALSVALAQVSMSIANTALGSHVSPLLWATLLGMVYGNVLHRPDAKKSLGKGIKFAKGRLLRLGIILYGFKVTLQQIAGIGFSGLATDIIMVGSTLSLALGLGQRWLGLDRSTSTLIGSGAAICGCSAVLATQPIVGGESHEVSAAVGTVVLGGTLSMFLYPLLYRVVPFLANSPKLMGIYTGSTIHEIAGVVAAGNAMGSDVAFTAVVTKLARVLLLAPVLTFLSWFQQRHQISSQHTTGKNGVGGSKTTPLSLPYFAFGFVALSALNSVVQFPAAFVKIASKISAFSLLCAMAGLGIDSDFQAIRQLGSKPLVLAGVLWTWLAIGGLGVARLMVGA